METSEVGTQDAVNESDGDVNVGVNESDAGVDAVEAAIVDVDAYVDARSPRLAGAAGHSCGECKRLPLIEGSSAR